MSSSSSSSSSYAGRGGGGGGVSDKQVEEMKKHWATEKSKVEKRSVRPPTHPPTHPYLPIHPSRLGRTVAHSNRLVLLYLPTSFTYPPTHPPTHTENKHL